MYAGLPGYLNWAAWLTTVMGSTLFLCILITVFLCVDFGSPAIIPYTNFFIVFFTFFLYGMALTAKTFAVSTVFNNANLALAAITVIHILTYFAPFGIFYGAPETYEDTSKGLKM
jgi:hypothetical protein